MPILTYPVTRNCSLPVADDAGENPFACRNDFHAIWEVADQVKKAREAAKEGGNEEADVMRIKEVEDPEHRGDDNYEFILCPCCSETAI